MTGHYYFEAGHRKAPCDGVRGMAKRMADEAVKTGKVKIQYAVDLYDWARKNETSSSVSYRFYSKEEYSDAGKFLERNYEDVKAILNTKKIHSVAGISAEQVKMKERSDGVKNSKEVQHVVGKQPLSIIKLQVLLTADLLGRSLDG